MNQGPMHSEDGAHCASCERSLAGRSWFRMRAGRVLLRKCMRCAFIDRPLLWRSATVASVVGTALVLLNQGDQIFGGTFPWAKAWYKLPLTYLVPFSVATYGALSNGYRGAGEGS